MLAPLSYVIYRRIFFFYNVICSWECGKSTRNNFYRGGMGHGGLREGTSTNMACIPRSRLHTPCIDRPPPSRSIEINPFLSAIAHWKDVCIVDPSVIDSRSPSRHITPHTTYERSKPTSGNTITVLANNNLYRRHLSISFGIHPASLVTASMLWLHHSLIMKV